MIIFPADNAGIVAQVYQKLPETFKNSSASQSKPKHPPVNRGANSSYYQPRKKLLGYPAIPLDKVNTSNKPLDPEYNFYMTLEDFDHLTKAKANSIAKKAASHGFTWIIGEHNRYLFYRPGEELPLPNHSYPKTMAQLIHDNKLMVQACHRYGLKYSLHQTCTMVTKDFLDHHPSMAAIDLRSGKRIKTGYGNIYAASIADPSFQKLYLERLKQLIKAVHPDGLMQDEIMFWKHTAGGSKAARQAFTKATGLTLPAYPPSSFFLDRSKPVHQKWERWRKAVIQNFNGRVTKICHANHVIRFNYSSAQTLLRYIPRRRGASLAQVSQYADMLGYECEPPGFRSAGYLYNWPNVICEMKVLRAIAAKKKTAPWVLFYPKNISDYTWNWLEARSQGLRLWWRSGNPKMVPAWQPLVHWEHNHELLLEDVQPVANIGVLLSLDTAEHNTAQTARDYLCGFNALCGALTASHLPYRVVLPRDLTQARLQALGINTLMLMGTSNMSDAHVAAIREFVKQGGTLIASGSASLKTPFGQRRKNFALTKVFGAAYVKHQHSSKDTLSLSSNSALSKSIQSPLHPDQGFNIVSPATGQVIGKLTGAGGKTYPGAIINHFGKGQVLYFPGHPERKYFLTFYTRDKMYAGQWWTDHRSEAFRKLLAAAAQFGNQPPAFIASNFPKGVVIEMRKQKYRGLDNIQVHLTNFMGGKIASGYIPIGASYLFPDVQAHRPDQSRPMTIAVHTKRPVKNVFVVSPDFKHLVELNFSTKGGYTKVKVPNLYRYEIICFTFNSGTKIRTMANDNVITKWPAQPVSLHYVVKKPLIGQYNPRATVLFADDPAWSGGLFRGAVYDRMAQIIYGNNTKYHTLTASFKWSKSTGPAQITLGAMQANTTSTIATFRMLLNGQVIATQETAFKHKLWGVYNFSIPAGVLKEGDNKIVIQSTVKKATFRWPPWLAVNFIKIISTSQK